MVPAMSSSGPQRYAIRVRGRLGPRWAPWFEGMALVAQDDGTTLIEGPVADQSALHGVLRTISHLGVPLVSITTADEPPQPPGRTR
jgi:hypothetical protein